MPQTPVPGPQPKVRPKNDAVAASVKNIREQKGLERQLSYIERLWHLELKNLTREKLEVTYELTRLAVEKQNLEYLQDDVEGGNLKQYTDNLRDKSVHQKDEDKQIDKFNYQNAEINKVQLRLPEIHRPVDILKENGLHQSIPIAKKPKLYRSNSVLRQKTHHANNGSYPTDRAITRTESKENVKNLSLPDIVCSDQSKTKFVRKVEKDMGRFMNVSTTPDAVNSETPHNNSPCKGVGRRLKRIAFPPVERVHERRHTVL